MPDASAAVPPTPVAPIPAPAPTPTADNHISDSIKALAASLQWKTGTITLKGGLAKINLTSDFRYLDSSDSDKVLRQMWGNRTSEGVLGMIFPADIGPLDKESWAVVIQYDDSGYVKDDDAEKINYDDLLKQMKKEAGGENPPVELVGWAAPPHYDKAAHKLYWAKDIKFDGERDDTLNYDIRILGRHGVLVLKAVAGMDQFDAIDKRIPAVLAMVDFQPGNTYGEFDPKIDKIAEYGLATLIAGGAIGAALKLGLFGLLLKYIVVVALALKKLLIVVIVAIVGAVKALWGKITGKSNKNQ